jgi:O-antigen/teichoic acid export membrane protein
VIALVLLKRLVSPRLEKGEILVALRETRFFALSVGLAFLAQQADVTIVGQWLGKSAAGLYGPAVTLTMTLALAPATLYNVMLPVLRRVEDEKREALRPLAERLMGVSVLLGLGLGALLALAARPVVLLLYGPEYEMTASILRLLSAVLALRCVAFGAGAVLTSAGWQNRRVPIQALAVALNVGLNLIVVERYGLMAVAGVYVLTEMVLLAGYLILLFRWYPTSAHVATPHRNEA